MKITLKTPTTRIFLFLATMLFTNIVLAQAPCTKVVQTTTGITITNKSSVPAKYRIERQNYPDSVTNIVQPQHSLALAITWCDTLFVSTQLSMPCSCTLATVPVVSVCSVLATNMIVQCSRSGNTLTYTITPLSSSIQSFLVHWRVGDGADRTASLPIANHPLGLPFLYTIKL